jgi:hypothetical protein
VRKADLASKGDEDVFQKIWKDFSDKSVGVSEAELRAAMVEAMSNAMRQIETERKT